MARPAFFFLVLLVATPAFADETPLEQVKPCQSTAECGALKCVENRCIDPFHPPEAPNMGPHGLFVGIAVMGGPAYAGVIGNSGRFDTAAQGSFLAALRAGVLIGRNELALEVSPASYFYYRNAPGPTFQANVTYAYLFPLSTHVSIPVRVGGGFFAGNVGGDVYAQLRLDTGLSIRVDHVLVDVYVPSFRYAISNVNGETPNLLSWEFGAGASYVF